MNASRSVSLLSRRTPSSLLLLHPCVRAMERRKALQVRFEGERKREKLGLVEERVRGEWRSLWWKGCVGRGCDGFGQGVGDSGEGKTTVHKVCEGKSTGLEP